MSHTQPGAEKKLTVLELCAGAGGQALGLEQAGFEHTALIEIDADACRTLRHNRPDWNVINGDVIAFDAKPYRGVDLVRRRLALPALLGRRQAARRGGRAQSFPVRVPHHPGSAAQGRDDRKCPRAARRAVRLLPRADRGAAPKPGLRDALRAVERVGLRGAAEQAARFHCWACGPNTPPRSACQKSSC